MSDHIRDTLAAIPIDELRRRAAIVDEITGIAPVAVETAERFAWNDGGGQSTVWYFTPDKRALLLTFDHETDLNLFAEGTYADQESLYRGVPEDLVRLVRNRPENYESLNLTDPDTAETIHYAGGVFWFDGEQWRPAEGFLAYCAREDLDPYAESGFTYCLANYRLDGEFTPEAIVEERATSNRYENEAARAAALTSIREIFARHR
ncbi:hypothetical protein [Streptomyces sp. SID3343]|uniref:hypothetical protein n=1 Tax=Streptomyces sp. SID3343 TaxID=2690260 RepID=UPI001368FF9F|nr:hypothetical protein [Streptomyces sp. SID3343]MYW05232.1 hypothetical protein [Streptomyces sp. SID3343]